MANEDPVSWMALEEGAEVRAADGSVVGHVTNVVADMQKDIFSGIAFRSGLLGTQQFAPAEIVRTITAVTVDLAVSPEEAGELEEYGS